MTNQHSAINLRKIGFKFIGILLFVASGLITFLYMTSNVVGVVACFIAGIQALGIESAKSFFSYVFIVTNASQLGKKISFGTLAVLAFLISIIATTGWGISMSYQIQDQILKKSDEYKIQQNYINTQNELFATTQKQIEDLKTQRDSQLAKMETVKNAWGKNYKTQKSIEQDKINNASAKYNQDISAKEQQLQAISASLNKQTGESMKGKGFQGLYIQLAKFINDFRVENIEPKPVIPDDVNFWINFCVSICLEFFGIGFIYLSMKEEGYSTAYASNNHTAGFKPQLAGVTSQDSHVIQNSYTDYPNNEIICREIHPRQQTETPKKNPIGFRPEKIEAPEPLIYSNSSANTKGENPLLSGHLNNSHAHYDNADVQPNYINQDDLKIYLDYMFKNQKENVSPGYMNISKNTTLTVEACRKIKGHLERLGVIQTNGAKTVIMMENKNAERLVYRNG